MVFLEKRIVAQLFRKFLDLGMLNIYYLSQYPTLSQTNQILVTTHRFCKIHLTFWHQSFTFKF